MDWKKLKIEVLTWLETLRVNENPYRYKLSASTDDSAFTSCFALFIYDLFGETSNFSDEKKKGWAIHLNSFQNPDYGYYEPRPYHHFDHERNRYQLTCFCLSALAILGEKPRYEFKFMEQYGDPESIEKYLYERGCDEGRASSGNKAMFLAIFLTHLYETTGEQKYKNLIDVWFNFHDRYVNSSGFWGQERSCHSYHGIQNGLHQFVIYWYWGRKLHHHEAIIDVALSLQSRDGFFSPTPGGEACHDYDVVHTLVTLSNETRYKRDMILKALLKAQKANLENQRPDGGFCQSVKQLNGYGDIIKNVPFIFSSFDHFQCYYRLRRTISIVKYNQQRINTGWTGNDRGWSESSLWDTWFRSLIIGEVQVLTNNEKSPFVSFLPMNFHNHIGLGHYTV